MDKVQIAKYAMMQVVALVYSMLACGTVVKLMNRYLQNGLPMSNFYYATRLVRDYGLWFFVIILGWTLLAAYYSSSLSTREVSSLKLAISGMVIAILFAVVATFMALMALGSLFIPPV
jgi:hypothetical protein